MTDPTPSPESQEAYRTLVAANQDTVGFLRAYLDNDHDGFAVMALQYVENLSNEDRLKILCLLRAQTQLLVESLTALAAAQGVELDSIVSALAMRAAVQPPTLDA